MSVQFGKWNFDGKPIDPQELEEVRPVLAPYSPDGGGHICKGNFAAVYCAFHTTEESHKEHQPFRLQSGAVITWDGRLDNGLEILERLNHGLTRGSTDVEIVAAAYERWGTRSFAMLIGDWALSVWNPDEQALILAKDFVGTRHLYYALERDHVTWCTILDPLVLFAGHRFNLEEEFIAGWVSFFPAAHLTPYRGIRAVPPSSFVQIARGVEKCTRYWEFDAAKQIRYRTDREYEEHFRAGFSESVRRRLRSNLPVLAELSGGMDSSSIVCMADRLSASSSGQLVETVSYYDDSEPNWNERPFFTRVEEHRGRSGLHVNVSCDGIPDLGEHEFVPLPSSDLTSSDAVRRVAEHLAAGGHRVLLCGIGGDEVLGGVPTPVPQLADLLTRGRLRVLAHALKVWALAKRKPWAWLLAETVREFLPKSILGVPPERKPPLWLEGNFVRRYRTAFRAYEPRLRMFGALPNFQESVRTLDGLRRQLACTSLRKNPPCEVRYPYLDRSLLDFLYSIPREQLVRPGERRSLMRRAMAGIVPPEILCRSRKAFVSRGPLRMICAGFSGLNYPHQQLGTCSLGLVDSGALAQTLRRAQEAQEIDVAPLLRLLLLEAWLKDMRRRGVLADGVLPIPRRALEPTLISAENFK